MSRIRTALVIALPLVAAANADAAIIYQARAATPNSIYVISDPDESSSFAELPGLPTEREFESRVGDQITFSGTDRFVNRFTTRLLAFPGQARGITADVELTLYENAGGLPGALLWSGVVSDVMLPTQISGVAQAEVSFTPNVLVPDSICFAIGFTRLTIAAGETRTLGVATTATATVGSSPVTTIHQLSADNSWFIEDISTSSGGLFRHIDARVEAIPAPPAVTFGLAIMFAARRRR